ncbi:hypothetical protein JX265_004909 [Neoarthrinium moseri]|uniref:RRM domain-containing protein n=1 Tax=Neoarthrinium moseri TaxID=1658444 RepID=A0A9P9WQB9_9PEZI|nr:hypothetical protein JX265_004909 [Neoarthrinium moseri]
MEDATGPAAHDLSARSVPSTAMYTHLPLRVYCNQDQKKWAGRGRIIHLARIKTVSTRERLDHFLRQKGVAPCELLWPEIGSPNQLKFWCRMKFGCAGDAAAAVAALDGAYFEKHKLQAEIPRGVALYPSVAHHFPTVPVRERGSTSSIASTPEPAPVSTSGIPSTALSGDGYDNKAPVAPIMQYGPVTRTKRALSADASTNTVHHGPSEPKRVKLSPAYGGPAEHGSRVYQLWDRDKPDTRAPRDEYVTMVQKIKVPASAVAHWETQGWTQE